jgi:uncharacterized protein YbjQ (UPF0145 family)
MATHLELARLYLEQGNYKKSLSELWYAEAQHRRDAEGTSDALALAEAIAEQADGKVSREAETLSGTLRTRVEVLRQPAPPEPSPYREGMPVTTGDHLPGSEITEYVGEVFGVVVRSRGAFPQLGARMKAFVGGELKTMTNLLERTRREAIERMVEQAADRGADAVIAMRFDAEAMADQWSEICAYGTAVKIAPRDSAP